MKKQFLPLLFTICIFNLLHAQTTDPKDTEVWEPEPRVVTTGEATTPPSDAIVLFDGTNTEHFTDAKGNPIQWEIKDSSMTVVKGTGDIQTKESFGDIQLHIEWRSPVVVKGEGEGRGNSGIFLQFR